MAIPTLYDVVVVGGGAVGLGATYEVAKSGKSVIVLEQNNFFNQAGSSGDLARMYRTMYTEGYMADMAKESMAIWDELEKDAGTSLRSMTGLLNFGDPKWDDQSPEGTLLGPEKNLKRLEMDYKILTAEQIEKKYPFRNLPKNWKGLYAPDNGVINVQLLLRTLSRLAKDYGAHSKQNIEVKDLIPHERDGKQTWLVKAVKSDSTEVEYHGEKIIITTGAYTNHVLKPSFGISLKLDIWEMVASYFNVNAGPNGTVFPSMWFQFDRNKGKRSQLFYGFPTVEWGPPNVARIAVDAATRVIKDPDQRLTNVINPKDIRDTQEYIKNHIPGVDSTVPAFSMTCLQTNVYDNMFVLDYIPEKYLKGGLKDSVAVFTAGWAMKFVPLLGRALKEMVLDGNSKWKRPEFEITRTGKKRTDRILVRSRTKSAGISSLSISSGAAALEDPESDLESDMDVESQADPEEQAAGSSYPHT